MCESTRVKPGHDNRGMSLNVPAARSVRVLHLAYPRKFRGRREGRVFCAPAAARAV